MNVNKLNALSFFMTLSLVSTTTAVWAGLISDNLTVNGENIVATATFLSPVAGDLYLATEIGGELYFIGQGVVLSKTQLAYQTASTYSSDIRVLDIPSTGIPAGNYPLYQVVTPNGASPYSPSNWIGGLSQITFSVNNTPATPVVSMIDNRLGIAKYKTLGCSQSTCHTTTPARNTNQILKGTSLAALKNAIKINPGDMGFLADPADPQFASDIDLQQIADYLKTL